MIRKRLLSWLMCIVLALSLAPVHLTPVMAEEAQDGQEELTQEEIQEAWDSDVEILETDVPCQTIEWGEEETSPAAVASDSESKSHQMVLVLDVSGSMSGNAITELRKACNNFVDDILTEDPAAGIAIVTYASSVTVHTFSGKYFSNSRGSLHSVINSLGASGSTAMNAGLEKADEILQANGTADEQYIIQMADGEPNVGTTYSGADAKYPSHSFASAIYNTFLGINNDYFIYSLGFFHNLSESGKAFPAQFMNDIQNQAYYEVTDADELTFSFEAIAQNISSDQLILNKSSLTLSKGETETLSLTFADSYTSEDKTVTWGTSDASVATVNSSGLVTAVGEGTCTITAEAGGFKTECPVTITAAPVKLSQVKRLVVYENKNGQDKNESKYELSSEAVVVCNGTEYKANSSGVISFPLPDSGEISVSKAGYVTRVFSVEQLGDISTVYLQKESDNPVINGIWIDGEDALVDDYEISMTKTSATSISVEVDWGNSSYGGISLVQEAESTAFNGNVLSMVLQNKYDVTKDVYVLATDAAGHSVKQKINFAVTNIAALDGASLSFGDKISLSLPDWPWIGGQDVSLNMDTLEAIPLEVSVDNGKVKWTVGIDIAKYTKTTTTEHNTNTGTSRKKTEVERKNAFEMIKEGVENLKNKKDLSKGISDVKNIKKRYKNAMKHPKTKYVIDVDCTILGYGEGYIDTNGKYQWIGGGIILNPSGSVSWGGQYAIGPVPMYWEAAISAEITARLSLMYKETNKKFIPEGELGLTVKANAGTGVGINSVATAGGGATIRLAPNATFYSNKNNYYKMEAGISLYLKAKLGILEWKYETGELKKTIDNSAKSAGVSSVFSAEELTENMYDTSQYTVQDLSYLKGTKFDNGGTAALYAEEEDTYAVLNKTFHTNSYEETNPQIVALEGNTRLAVWVDAVTTDVNDILLYYSYYDGLDWTEPAVILNDGTADFSPSVCVSNKKAYVIWQNAETAFDTEAGTPDAAVLAANTGISVAEFKPTTQTFTVTALTEPDEVLDMQPAIQSDGTTVAAAWVRNTDNEWFGKGTSSQIVTKTLDGTEWSETTIAAENLAAVTSLAVDYQNGKVNIACTMDTDGDIGTVQDTELYVNNEKVTDDAVVDSAVMIQNHTLYWLSEATLMKAEDLDNFEAQQVLADGISITGDYQIAESEEDKAILYTVPADAGSEIYGAFWDAANNTWGTPMALTNAGNNITLFGGVWVGGSLSLLCNSIEVNFSEDEGITENTYGQASLLLMEYNKMTSLDVTECIYYDADIVAGSSLPIYLTVQNNGMQPVDGVQVQITNESGTVVSEVKFNQTVLSGETAELEMKYPVQEADIGKEYTVSCQPLGIKKYSDGKTGTIAFSYEKINLDSVAWGFTDDENILIYGYAENLGYSDLENVKVELYKDAADGEPVDSMTIANIDSMDSSNVKFSVPFEEATLYYISVLAELKNGQELTDSEYIYLKEDKVVSNRTLQGIKVSDAKTAYTVGEALNVEGFVVSAMYKDGTSSDVTREAFLDYSKVNMNAAGTYEMTISYENYKQTVSITVSEKSAGNSGTNNSGTGGSGTDNTGSDNPGTGNQTNAVNGCVVDKTSNTAVYTNGSSQNASTITVPSTVKVGAKTYPVTSIAANAFKNNTKLKKVTIPSSVTTIGDSAFEGCSALTTVTMGTNVTTIGAKAFYGCKKLKKVTIPAKVKSIGKSAFQNCKKLKNITIKTTKLKAKTVGAKAFKGIYAKAVFKLPKKQKKVYQKILLKKGATKKMKFK